MAISVRNLLGATLLWFTAIAVQAQTLTLDTALDSAFANNPELAAARWEIDIAEGGRQQAGLIPNPVVSWDSEDTRRDSRTTTITLSQTLELGGKRGARVDVATRAQDAAALTLEQRRNGLRADVIDSYYAALRAQERLDLAQRSLALAERGLIVANGRVSAGKSSPVEATRAQVQLSEIRLELNRSLPEGVVAVTVYDRTNLVEKAIATVKKNLFEGALLVVAVLFLFLGNIRAALITAMVIPLAMLFTFTGMFTNKVSANLMSLGALDFGIIVDGAVVIVENAIRRLAHAQQRHGRLLTRSERLHEVFSAAKEARRALIFGQLIIMVVYLPIFALTGVAGKMFHPMAFTVVIALLGAMILSVTFVPAAIALFVTGKVKEEENLVMRTARRAYAPVLDWVMARRPLVFGLAVLTLVGSGLVASRMGSEFIPSLSEGDFAQQALRVPGTSLTQSVQMQQQLEKTLMAQVPEIQRVFARTGTAEIASDPVSERCRRMPKRTGSRRRWSRPIAMA